MKLKNILLLLVLMFMTGCTAEYNLVINGDKTVDESITILNPNIFWGDNLEEINEQLDWTLIFAKDETEPAYFYNQKKIVGDVYSGVKYDYSFNIDDFESQSEFLKNCFDSYEFTVEAKRLNINATDFKCSNTLGDSFNLKINIIVDGKVISGNYDENKANQYTWNISSNENVDIGLIVNLTDEDMTIGNLSSNKVLIITIIILVVLLCGVMIIAYKKMKENNN